MIAHPVPQEGQKVYTLDELMAWVQESEMSDSERLRMTEFVESMRKDT